MTRPGGPLRELGPALKVCLGAGIPGLAPLTLTASDVAPDAGEIMSEGLAPVALKVLRVGTDVTERRLRDRFARVAMVQELRSLAAESTLERITGILAPAGICFVVIKGPAVARLHPEGWPRPYADIDLLVEPQRFPEAMMLIQEQGYTYPSTSQPPWPWFDRYCREGLNLGGAGDVDVHHHVAPWIFGTRVRSIDVIHGAEVVRVRDSLVPMASPEHSTVIAALHVLNDLWKGQRGLVSWRDLIILTRRLGGHRVRAAFDDAGLGWLFDLVVGAVQQYLPGLLDNIECGPAKIPLRYAWRMRGLGWERSTPLSRQRLAWAIRLPIPQAGAFVAGSGLPSRRYIRARHGSYREYWRQAWVEALSTFSGADHRMDKKDTAPTSRA